MSKIHTSEKAFGEIISTMRTAIFTRAKMALMPDIYTLKLSDVAHNQKPILRLFQNLKHYEAADYNTFLTQQKVILSSFQKTSLHRYFKVIANFYEALAHNMLGNYKEAVALMQCCHVTATDMCEERVVAEVETGLGHIFSEYGYQKIASHYFETSLCFANTNDIESLKIINGFGLLKLYFDQNKPTKMLPILEQMQHYISDTALPVQLNLLRWQMEYHLLLKEWGNLAAKRETFEQVRGDFFNPYFFIAIYLLDAKLATYTENRNEAAALLEKALQSARDIGSKAAESIVYREMADSFIQQNDTQRATKYLGQSLSLAQEMDSNIAFSFTYEHLHQLALKKGDLEAALDYFKQYHFYTERLNEQDEKINTQLLKSTAMLKEKTATIKMLQQELSEKADELQMTQFVLQQKKQVIEDVSAFMQSLRKENIAQNKMLSQLEKRLKESTVFEQSKDQIIHSCQAEINKWSVGFEAKFPMISKTELKICFYTLKGFSNKEIASILFTTTKNIEQTKYRIKKKLTFDTTQSLEVFLKAMI